MKVVVEAKSGERLGCAVLDLEWGEMMSAIHGEGRIRCNVCASDAVSFNNLFGTLDGGRLQSYISKIRSFYHWLGYPT